MRERTEKSALFFTSAASMVLEAPFRTLPDDDLESCLDAPFLSDIRTRHDSKERRKMQVSESVADRIPGCVVGVCLRLSRFLTGARAFGARESLSRTKTGSRGRGRIPAGHSGLS